MPFAFNLSDLIAFSNVSFKNPHDSFSLIVLYFEYANAGQPFLHCLSHIHCLQLKILFSLCNSTFTNARKLSPLSMSARDLSRILPMLCCLSKKYKQGNT